VQEVIKSQSDHYKQIFVAYADCGTGGALDRVLKEFNIERLPGAHCYDFFSGSGIIQQFSDDEPGTFYLTDFLTTHFNRLVKKGLGLDKHPELLAIYFSNYRRLVYLSQKSSSELKLIHHHTGLENLELDITENIIQWQK